MILGIRKLSLHCNYKRLSKQSILKLISESDLNYLGVSNPLILQPTGEWIRIPIFNEEEKLRIQHSYPFLLLQQDVELE